MSSNQLFGKYSLKTKKVKIKSLNAEVTVSEMTVEKSNEYYARMFTGVPVDGEPTLNAKEIGLVKIEKVAEFMIEPKMSAEELSSLSAKASEAINEISDAIDELSGEGN